MAKIALKGKRVMVLGLGTRGGGVGVVRFLVERGAKVLVSDLKSEEELPSLEEIVDLPINFSLGGHHSEIFETDLIVRNPAVPHTAKVLQEAKRRGIPVMMEPTLFFAFCPSSEVSRACSHAGSRIIGVTGTKGKTTTTLLLEKVLKEAGEKVVAAGNFGRSMLEVLPQVSPKTWVVLELSSFQLEGLKVIKRSPHIAVITNFFPDHLNRYRDMAEYAQAKSYLFRYQKRGDLLFIERGVRESFDLSHLSSRICEFAGGPREAVERLSAILGLPFDSEIEVNPPYRLEFVGEKEGIRFINDSCATNPGATLFALEKFRNNRVVLITGGTDKNLDYSELSERINIMKTPTVLLSGSATEKLKVGLREELILIETSELEKAVRVAFSAACPAESRPFCKKGGRRWVLFSPAAASFELFDDEFDRGERFNGEVKEL